MLTSRLYQLSNACDAKMIIKFGILDEITTKNDDTSRFDKLRTVQNRNFAQSQRNVQDKKNCKTDQNMKFIRARVGTYI